MNVEIFAVVIAFVTGLGLGLFYFGGLWLTVRQLPHTQRPVLLLVVSFLLRLAIALICFYLIVKGDLGLQSLLSLLSCILGFLIVRAILIRRVTSSTSNQ